MKYKSTLLYLTQHRNMLTKALMLASFLMQSLGTFYLNTWGLYLVATGMIFGIALLFQTKSIKEALTHVVFSVFPIPITVLAMVLTVYLVGIIANGFSLTGAFGFLKFMSSFFLLLAIFLYVSWPFITGVFGLKYATLRWKKSRNQK